MPVILGKLSMGMNFSKSLKTNILQKKREFNTDMYVHEFIAGHRTEEIPHCKWFKAKLQSSGYSI